VVYVGVFRSFSGAFVKRNFFFRGKTPFFGWRSSLKVSGLLALFSLFLSPA